MYDNRKGKDISEYDLFVIKSSKRKVCIGKNTPEKFSIVFVDVDFHNTNDSIMWNWDLYNLVHKREDEICPRFQNYNKGGGVYRTSCTFFGRNENII